MILTAMHTLLKTQELHPPDVATLEKHTCRMSSAGSTTAAGCCVGAEPGRDPGWLNCWACGGRWFLRRTSSPLYCGLIVDEPALRQ